MLLKIGRTPKPIYLLTFTYLLLHWNIKWSSSTYNINPIYNIRTFTYNPYVSVYWVVESMVHLPYTSPELINTIFTSRRTFYLVMFYIHIHYVWHHLPHIDVLLASLSFSVPIPIYIIRQQRMFMCVCAFILNICRKFPLKNKKLMVGWLLSFSFNGKS